MLMLLVCIGMKGQYNPTNPIEPGSQYSLTLIASPSEAGSFNISSTTSYSEGTTVGLRAYTNSHFRFIAWEQNGEVISTSSSISYTMPANNVRLVAHYVYDPSSPSEPSEPDIPVYSTLSLVASPSDAGYFNISSGNRYEVGTSVSLRAYTNSNFRFVNWKENGEIISTSSSFTYVVPDHNTTLVANYEYTPSSPGEPSEARLIHRLYLKCNPSGGGYFNISSGNEYAEYSSVSLRAYSNQYYTFLNWTIGDSVISTSYSFNYEMPNRDVELTANYSYDYNPGNPNEPSQTTDTRAAIYGMTENGVQGQTITYPIYLENSIPVNSIVVDIQFPQGFVANVSELVLSGRAAGHESEVKDLGDNSYRIYVTGTQPFDSDNGKIMDIPVTVPETAVMGNDYPVNLSHGVMIDAEYTTAISVRNGNIYVEKVSEDGLYARFSFDKLRGRVKFTNLSSDKARSFHWDFGDGTTSTEASPMHTYAKSGYYNVTLVAAGETDEDRAEMTVLINEESTWKSEGTFYLSDTEQGVRYFTTPESLFDFIASASISDNLAISVKAGNSYSCALDDKVLKDLKTINTGLAGGNHTLSISKFGIGSNPVFSLGQTGSQTDAAIVNFFIDFGKVMSCEGVEMKLWGISFDPSKIWNLGSQTIHSGNKTSQVDFSVISSDLKFVWTVAEEPENVSGYAKTGERIIPSSTIVNEREGNYVLEYTVNGLLNGAVFCSFNYSITVTPSLVGLFNALLPVNETVLENTSVTLSWNSITNAVYDVYLWNAANAKPKTPVATGINALQYESRGFCQFGNDYKWQVVAYNESQSLSSDTMCFSIRALPDLHVYDLDCSEPVAGKKFTVEWTVRNDGSGPTGATRWKDYIWLVTDVYAGTASSSSNNSKLLATVDNVKSLDGGESYHNSIDLVLDERISGNYYLIVAADMYSITGIQWSSIGGTVINPYNPVQAGDGYRHLFATTTSSYNLLDESGETRTLSDNFFYKKLDIAVPLLPDIQVSNIKAKVIPLGNIDSRVYEEVIEATIPTALTYAGIAHNDVFYNGKKVKVTASIDNKGTAETGKKSIKNVLYMSNMANPESDGARVLTMGTNDAVISLAPGQSHIVEFTIMIPFDWHGETYFHVYADFDDVVNEMANIVNNRGSSDRYDILLCPGADMVPYDLTVPKSVDFNTPFKVRFSEKNIGPGIPYNGGWTDEIFISKNKDGLDESAVKLHSITVPGGVFSSYAAISDPLLIIPAEEYSYSGDNNTFDFTVQCKGIEDGTYYIYVYVDAKNILYEYGGEDNNIIRSEPISVRHLHPDLTAEFLSFSEDTVSTGREIAISWKLKNEGNGDIKDQTVKDEFYASVNMDGSNGVLFASVENNVWIAAGAEKTMRANVTVPSDSKLDGVRYVYVKTDVKKNIDELNTDNNTSSVKKHWFRYQANPVIVDRSANISVSNLKLSENVRPGKESTLTFVVTNTGESDLKDTDVSKEIFVADKYDSPVSSMSVCEVTAVDGSVAELRAGASKTISVKFKTSDNIIGGNKYLHLYLDRANKLAESKTNDNHGYSQFFLNGNLPDLTVSEASLADTIYTSTNVNLTFTVKNQGEWKSNKTSVPVYLSSSSTSLADYITLASLSVPALEQGKSATFNASFSIPDKYFGKWHVQIRPDRDNKNLELDESNNIKSIPVTVMQSPLPDLTVTSISTDETITLDKDVNISYSVLNNGEAATRTSKWSDTFYLSAGTVLNTGNAIKLGSKAHVGTLNPGAAYSSAVSFRIPSEAHGNYMLFVVTDAADAICEANENNSFSIPVYVNGSSDTPADITVDNVQAPASFKAGESVTIRYNLKNVGDFTASGTLNDVIYLSKDNKFDMDDVMVGTVSGKVTINPGDTYARSATGRITNMPEGDYYVIVKSNSTRTITEKTDENNVAVSSTASRLSFNSIYLDGIATFTNSSYCKLDVPATMAGKTIGFYLEHPVEASAGLYAAYEYVPTTAKSDCQSSTLVETMQELLMPNVKPGTYYILAQDNSTIVNSTSNVFTLDGSVPSVGSTNLTVSARIINFGATTLSISEGGNGGWVTTDINGALFDSIMDFRLKKGNDVIPAEAVTYNGMTKSHVTFNLNDAEAGTYDVISELPDGTVATLPAGFKVIPGTSVSLGVKLDAPSTVAAGSYVPVSVTYANGGTTNCEIYGMFVAITNGYVSKDIKGFEKHNNQLQLDLDTESDSRGYISIPPGTQKTINFFMYQAADCSISVYILE